jgi:hypothetical protein
LNDSAEYYHRALFNGPGLQHMTAVRGHLIESLKIGRASCRERVS